jgi:hypothetical protein
MKSVLSVHPVKFLLINVHVTKKLANTSQKTVSLNPPKNYENPKYWTLVDRTEIPKRFLLRRPPQNVSHDSRGQFLHR